MYRVFRLAVVLSCATLALSTSSAAQAIATTQTSSVEVLVSDDHVSPKDLTSADFTLTLAGSQKAAEAKADPMPGLPSALKPLTNVGSRDLGAGLTIVVLDTIHTRQSDEMGIRERIVSLLASSAAKNKPITLMMLTPNGMRVVHEYTSGSAMLTAAIAAAKGTPSPIAATLDKAELAAETQRIADFLKGAGANAGLDANLHGYPEAIFNMFYAVTQAGRGLPGRKSLLWLTTVIPFDLDPRTRLIVSPVRYDSGPAVQGRTISTSQNILTDKEIRELNIPWRRAVNALFNSGTTVYPVVVFGPQATDLSSAALSAMNALAAVTGGRVTHNNYDPLPSLEGFIHPEATYSITLPQDNWCGKNGFCEVSVSAKRGGKAYAAQGFFKPDQVTPVPAAEILGRELTSPLNSADIEINVDVSGVEKTASGRKLSLAAILAPGSNAVDPQKLEVSLELGIAAFTADGKIVQKASFNAAGKVPQEAVQQINQYGMDVKGFLEVPPGEYTFKVAMHDKLHERFGSVTFRKKIE